jgi:hypothetical protein
LEVPSENKSSRDGGVYFLAILLLINTIDSNVATVNIGRIIHDGNSGTEGEGDKVDEGD